MASNLTPAGRVSCWTDADIFRAIRNSVDPDGRWLVIMSYTNAGKLSDEDIRAVIACSRPAGNRKAYDDQPDHLNLLGIAMFGAGMPPKGEPVSVARSRCRLRVPLAIWRIYPVVSGLPARATRAS